MKRQFILILIITIFSCGWFHASAQYGLRLSYIKHSGDMGYLVKPAIGYELVLASTNISDRFQGNGCIGFMSLNTWLDTVPTGTFLHNDDGITLLPSYMVYHDITVFIFGINLEYKILDRRFTPVVGADIYMNLIEYDYDNFVPNLVSSSVTNEHAGSFSILPRIGVSYEINERFLFRSGFGKNLGFDNNFNSIYFWKSYFEAIFYF